MKTIGEDNVLHLVVKVALRARRARSEGHGLSLCARSGIMLGGDDFAGCLSPSAPHCRSHSTSRAPRNGSRQAPAGYEVVHSFAGPGDRRLRARRPGAGPASSRTRTTRSTSCSRAEARSRSRASASSCAKAHAVFVPAGAEHRFVGYEQLSVLVIFEKTAALSAPGDDWRALGRGARADRRLLARRELPLGRADLPARQPSPARAARSPSTSSRACSATSARRPASTWSTRT